MADPLSVAASIAGVISLADSVVRLIHGYAKAASVAENEVLDLAIEVKSLSDVLHSLPALASRLEAGPFATTFRMHHIYGCQQTLLRIETRLKKAQDDFKRSTFRRLRRRLQWPFTAPEVKTLLEMSPGTKEILA